MVRDARRCRASHHEGLRPHPCVTASPLSLERAVARVSKDEASRKMLYLRQVFTSARPLPAPSRADQEAEAERDPDGCKRALRNDVFQRFLDRIRGSAMMDAAQDAAYSIEESLEDV